MPALNTPLNPVSFVSIYNNQPLPSRMAKCTPDTAAAIQAVINDLRGMGHDLRLSDLFRSYDMQKQAYLDYKEGRKTAFSPPPGGSMHEAGRAMDIDLGSMGVPLSQFWEIAAARGFTPIIDAPDASRNEAWHFDCRGSHDAVYQYVKQGKGGNQVPPYTQMARSAIIAIGVQVDGLPEQGCAFLQAALIRLGFDPGAVDGVMGSRTQSALRDAGADTEDPAGSVSLLLRQRFPAEFS
jgi:zinc D-Ala-D-Ala carboxypeptidase